MTAAGATWAGPGTPVARHSSHKKEARGEQKWPGAAGWAHRAWGSSSCRGCAGRALKPCQLEQAAVAPTQHTAMASLSSASTTTAVHPTCPATHSTGRQDTQQGGFPLHLTILVIQTIIGFPLKNPSLFISAVRQKGCSHKNFFSALSDNPKATHTLEHTS